MAESETLAPALAERERVLHVLRDAAPRLRARGIRRLSLFESMARGQARPGSAIDLLIEVSPAAGFGLSDLLDLQEELGDLLSRPIKFAFASEMRPWLLLMPDKTVRLQVSRRLPAAMNSRHPEVSWRDIAAIGNILRHGYPAVNRDIIWQVASEDLQVLAAAVDKLLAQILRHQPE